jgi:hypothetical protein
MLVLHAPPALAGDLIDFETLPDATPTVDQQEIGLEYASLGVTFSLINNAGDVVGTPNIAKVGAPDTAFVSCLGDDTPVPGQGVGDSFLTDNTTVASLAGSLLITYASPVAQAAGVIIDTDCRNCTAGGTCGGGCEQWTVEARDADGLVIDTFIVDGEIGPPGPPCNDVNGPGDGRADGWFFNHATADIFSVVIRYTGNAPINSVGLAFDNFTPASIPALQASADVTPTALCYGQVVELTGSASGGVPPYAYRWQEETAPGVWTDVASGQSAVFAPSSDTVLRLLVEDAVESAAMTTPVPLTVQPVIYEVSQESAPGAGDFALLGTIVPYESTETAAGYYGWTSGTTPFSGPAPRLTDNRSHLFLVKGADGLALYVVHDDGAGAAGGRAETQVDLDCDAAEFMVRDDAAGDPSDIFNVLNDGTRFQMRNVWVGARTDGYTIGVLDCGWTAELVFTDLFGGDPTISGLDSWVAFSNAGEETSLVLEENRRVRISARIGCPADLDGSGSVGFTDLTLLLGNWGPCAGSCPEDLDCDGTVGFGDLTTLLGNWGPCST